MAFQIRINPAALHAAANREKVIAETVHEAAAKLSMLSAKLGDAWDGGASEAAIDSLHQIRSGANNVGEGADSGAERISSIANAFAALDGGTGVGSIKPLPTGLIPMPPINPFTLVVSDSLRIVPDQVREIGAECRIVSDTLMQSAMELTELVSNLASDWEGASYNRFADDTAQLVAAFREAAQGLEEYANEIITAATRYEELDASLA